MKKYLHIWNVSYSVHYMCTQNCPDKAPQEASAPAFPKKNTDSLSNPLINFTSFFAGLRPAQKLAYHIYHINSSCASCARLPW